MAELIYTPFKNDANLKAYYRLEDVNDYKTSYNLTNNNTVTFTAGRFGNGANFGASNSNKSLTANSDLGINGGACSISCWVRNLANIASGSWVYVGQSGIDSYVRYEILYQYNSGTPRLAFGRVRMNIAADNSYYTITMNSNLWYHLVLTYDTSNIRGYVNGILVSGPTSSSGNGGNAAGHDGFAIGAGPDGSSTANAVENYASAIVDDVAIFNDVLTQAEITSIFNSGGGFLAFM